MYTEHLIIVVLSLPHQRGQVLRLSCTAVPLVLQDSEDLQYEDEDLNRNPNTDGMPGGIARSETLKVQPAGKHKNTAVCNATSTATVQHCVEA